MTATNANRIRAYFDPFKEVSIAPLAIFRIIFGALLLCMVTRFMFNGWIESLYIEPQYYFGYLGFEWVKPLPGNWMYLPFILMIGASLGILVGFLYRYSAALFFIAFTYVELLDKSNYLNHHYFVSLMCFLLILVPANRYLSIDAIIRPNILRKTTYQWHIGIFKFQLACVYVFAGFAKLHSDWLFDAQPLKIWLQAHHHLPIVGGLLEQEWVAYAFSWFGCVYDLFIVVFLLTARFRPFAYFFVIVFHILTWYLFPIGIFPWVMILSTLIFFSPEWHQKRAAFIEKSFKLKTAVQSNLTKPVRIKLIRSFLLIYIFVQIVLPFRYVMYPGSLFWNEEGFRFSWRVMLMHKEGHATFYLVDKATGRKSEINNGKFLTATQEDQMATQPDMILQYARILKEHFDGKVLHYGDYKFPIHDPEIHAEIYVSLNGRPSQLFVDKKHDLTQFKYDLGHRKWIEPFNP